MVTFHTSVLAAANLWLMTMLRPPLCSRLSQEHPKYKQTAAAAKAIPAEVDGEEEGVAHDRPPDPDPHEST